VETLNYVTCQAHAQQSDHSVHAEHPSDHTIHVAEAQNESANHGIHSGARLVETVSNKLHLQVDERSKEKDSLAQNRSDSSRASASCAPARPRDRRTTPSTARSPFLTGPRRIRVWEGKSWSSLAGSAPAPAPWPPAVLEICPRVNWI
jgi:hypothetical protein